MKQKMTKGQYTLLFISFITLAWFGWIRNGGDVVVKRWAEQDTLQLDTSILLNRLNYIPTKPVDVVRLPPVCDCDGTISGLGEFTPILNHSRLNWREIR